MSIGRHARARRQLDERFRDMRPVSQYQPPPKGWIRAVRDALGMSGAQLGLRLGITAQSVADIEKSETAGTIQLRTLRRVAEALDCSVIYALVPKTSLEDMVEARARYIARKALRRVEHTMALEAQEVDREDAEAQIDAYIRDHVSERKLWRTD